MNKQIGRHLRSPDFRINSTSGSELARIGIIRGKVATEVLRICKAQAFKCPELPFDRGCTAGKSLIGSA